MSPQVERLATEILGLPASSRSFLMKQIASSLEEEELPRVSDTWLKEIEKRDKEISEGKVQCIPAEEVLLRARERIQ